MLCSVSGKTYITLPLCAIIMAGQIEFVRRFGYTELVKATEGFRKVIYTNYHGSAYTAKFKGGEVALVKELKSLDLGRERFYEEVQLLGRLRHRHLLTLRGFCTGRKRFPFLSFFLEIYKQQFFCLLAFHLIFFLLACLLLRMLVYDNIENGSLKEHLNGKKKNSKHYHHNIINPFTKRSVCFLIDPLKTPLNWKTRIQIAIGVAAALVSCFLNVYLTYVPIIILLKRVRR